MREADLWRRTPLPLLLLALSAACSRAVPSVTPEIVTVHASSATYPWLKGVYDCAPASVAVEISPPDSAAIDLRLGEPRPLVGPAYQIGTDELVVAVHPQTGSGPLTADLVRRIFAGEVTNWKEVGGNDLAVQVWTFARQEDVQQLFDRLLMQGQPVTSLARLAVSAQNMSDSVGAVPGSIGFLPRRWKAGNTRAVLEIASAPVLALVKGVPEGAARVILHCLQAVP